MNTFQEFDLVEITGWASSPVKRYERLRGVVATVSDDAIKIWPEQVPTIHLTGNSIGNEKWMSTENGKKQEITIEEDGGKIWFPKSQIESMTLLERGDS